MIVKLDILNQNTLQVTLVEYKERVNTFIAHRTDPTLGKCIGLGCLWRGEHDFHLFSHKHGVKGGTEFAIMIVDEKAQRFCARSISL